MDLFYKANILRALSLISTTNASSGHPTSCLSAADIVAVLFDKYFKYDLKNPNNPNNDRFILSKGHAAPIFYAAFALSGGLDTRDLLNLRMFGSSLEGHPTPKFKFADVITGSLGQGLSIAAGIALNAKKDNLSYKTFTLIGDGESSEGQIYEACNFSAYYKLNNLITILDVNGLGLIGKTAFYYDIRKYEKIFRSLGFITITIDGHNFDEIGDSFEKALNNNTEKPYIIIAKTIKGKGVSFLEGREDFHGKFLKLEDLEKALIELSISRDIVKNNSVVFNLKVPLKTKKINLENGQKAAENIDYKMGDEIATREAFGNTLVQLGKKNPLIYALDADISNSTYTDKFGKVFPDRFIECFVAEQNMVGVAQGLSTRGKIPFSATFGAFLTRAYDQMRMAYLSGSNIKMVGSHAGVSIGEDGASQMALEDIAMISAFPNSVVLHPCDAVSCTKLVEEQASHTGFSYLRTLRIKTKVIYDNKDDFKIGGAKVLRSSNKDLLVIVAAGATVFEALEAYEKLKKDRVKVSVIDAYSIKPLDKKTIAEKASQSFSKIIITVEDHYINGGLGDMVLSEVKDEKIKVIKLGINGIPCSGDKDSLFKKFGIDAESIAKKVKEFTVDSSRYMVRV